MHDAPYALVVDDAPAARHRVAVLLQLAGWRVYEAVGMPAAVRAAAQLRPDLVVTEAKMRDGSGPALLRQLRANGSRARFLVLTARPTARVRAQAAAVGAGCLAKPVDPRRLVTFLRGRPAAATAPHHDGPVRVAAQRVYSASTRTTPVPTPAATRAATVAAAVHATVDEEEGPSWLDRQRALYLSALPHHLAYIAESARAGNSSAVAEAAKSLADESGRWGHPDVAGVAKTIAADAERGVLSQPRLMQLVLLASAARSAR